MKSLLHLLPWLAALACCGCRGNDFQSALHPAGSQAREIAWLWWLMVGVYGTVFVITLGLAAAAVLRKKAPDGAWQEMPGGSVRFVVIAGIVVPSVILLAMLAYSLRTSAALRAPETELTIDITGYRWWWDVRYPEQGIVTANEIRVPVGVPVRLQLRSADVIHSFWVPNLQGKMDMLPDHMNRFWLRADRPGVYRGTCAEFCGDQHAWMGVDVIAMPVDEFEAWLNRRAAPPDGQETARRRDPSPGLEVFFRAGCAACHAIAGTGAVANVGPDLTLLGERRSLAASALPNHPENLARWIADPQRLKPGNLMPPTDLDPEDLQTLVEYLQTLR